MANRLEWEITNGMRSIHSAKNFVHEPKALKTPMVWNTRKQ